MFTFFEYKKRSNNGKSQCFSENRLSTSDVKSSTFTHNFGDRFVVPFTQNTFLSVNNPQKSFFVLHKSFDLCEFLFVVVMVFFKTKSI
jgi:hypothetical protein